MNIKLLIFIILLILFSLKKKNLYIENFTNDIRNSYILIKEVRSDTSIPYLHNLSQIRSTFLYNYLFNLNIQTPINKEESKLITFDNYIYQICFIKRYEDSRNKHNLIDGILEITNKLIYTYFDSEFIVTRNTNIFHFGAMIRSFMKLKLKEDIKICLNYELPFLDNEIIFERIISIILDYDNDMFANININNLILSYENVSNTTNLNIYNSDGIQFTSSGDVNKISLKEYLQDAIIYELDRSKLYKYQTLKNYDDIDILIEAIDQALVQRVNLLFSKRYKTFLNLELYKIKNLYYSGNIDYFNFNEKFC